MTTTTNPLIEASELRTGMLVSSANRARKKARKKASDILTEAVPDDVLIEWSVRLFSLMNLAWQYVETVLDISAQMKIAPLKPLSRTVRGLKAEYERFRWPFVLRNMEVGERDRAEAFEDHFEQDFKILFFGIDTEVRKLKLNADYATLAIAVHQAITICAAVKVLARRIDRQLSEIYKVPSCDCSLVQSEFLKMAELLPYFAGDAYQPNLDICERTAEILANRMESVEVKLPELTTN